MFSNAFGWPHLIIILAVVLLLFGATRLPALSRSLGQSIKIFRREVKTEAPESDDDEADELDDETPASTSSKASSSEKAGSKKSKSSSSGDSSSKK